MRRSTVSYPFALTREQQEQLVRDLSTSIVDGVVARIHLGEIPEYWDGVELRRYLADLFERETVVITNRTRLLNYRNEVLIKNL